MPVKIDSAPQQHPSGPALAVDVWRGGKDGRRQRFDVPRRNNQTVLDVVTYIQRRLDPTLAYRFACRVGVCGSCAMNVNGRPRWTCRTRVSQVAGDGKLDLAPLSNLPIIRDLVADLAPFFDKVQRARGRFEPGKQAADRLAKVAPTAPERAAADAAIECIGCAVCYSACDVVAWQPDYLGPAALNRAWAAYNDVRDADRPGVLAAVSGDGGCHSCHTHQACTDHCPIGLSPTRSIAGLKRASASAYLRRRLGS
jgi:fumarate reductase iron-sulfur subunit